jgi:uncharacterized membrane protein YphA (DoxX/SURF4 family)
MKYLVNILRVLVGLLFIFSGLIKANDPTGFSIKLDEYFSVFSADLEAKQDSVTIFITTPDGTNSIKKDIQASNPVTELKAKNNPWKAVSLGNNLTDSVYFSDAVIYWGSQELYTASLNAEDSNAVLLEVTIKYAVNDKNVGEQIFVFNSFKENSQSSTVDLSDYLVSNSRLVNFLQSLRPYAVSLAVFLCAFEIILGLSLLIGWAPKLTISLLVILMLFFTFLTWYSAVYNKVTDCGCFGDAIKLTPWQSFNKDIILSISILIILIGLKHVKAIFSKPFAARLLTVFTLLSVGFASYCYHYLPVKNFLKFKVGNDIEKMATIPDDAPSDVYTNIFIYSKDGQTHEFSLEEMGNRDLKAEGYVFVDRIDKLIRKGYEPEIYDFKMMDEGRTNDYVDVFFADSSFKLLIVINEVESANTTTMDELQDILQICKKNKITVYPLTASSKEDVEAFRHEHQLDMPFYYGDKTNLKSIVRSNPGLLLFKDNVVHNVWPSTRIPSTKRFLKQLDK